MTFFGIDQNNLINTINPNTGAWTLINNQPNTIIPINSLTFNCNDNSLYGTTNNTLYKFNPVTGSDWVEVVTFNAINDIQNITFNQEYTTLFINNIYESSGQYSSKIYQLAIGTGALSEFKSSGVDTNLNNGIVLDCENNLYYSLVSNIVSLDNVIDRIETYDQDGNIITSTPLSPPITSDIGQFVSKLSYNPNDMSLYFIDYQYLYRILLNGDVIVISPANVTKGITFTGCCDITPIKKTCCPEKILNPPICESSSFLSPLDSKRFKNVTGAGLATTPSPIYRTRNNRYTDYYKKSVLVPGGAWNLSTNLVRNSPLSNRLCRLQNIQAQREK